MLQIVVEEVGVLQIVVGEIVVQQIVVEEIVVKDLRVELAKDLPGHRRHRRGDAGVLVDISKRFFNDTSKANCLVVLANDRE
jgi:hypothetical protein